MICFYVVFEKIDLNYKKIVIYTKKQQSNINIQHYTIKMRFHHFLEEELSSLLPIEELINLFNTTKENIGYKKDYYHWNLNLRSSLNYYKNPIFRNLIKSKITNPMKQLSLQLQNTFEIDRVDDKGLRNVMDVYPINLRKTKHLTNQGVKFLGNCHTLDLSGCTGITDEGLKYLSKCHTLDLRWCINITDEDLNFLETVKYWT